MLSDIIQGVLGRSLDPHVASVKGYQRYCVQNRVYPAMVKGSGDDFVRGIAYLDIDSHQLRLLDQFEGEMYQRVLLEAILTEQSIMAYAYICKPTYQHLLTSEIWTLDCFREDAQQEFLNSFPGWTAL